MTLLWTPRAWADVAAVLAQIATEDPGAVGQFYDRLLELVLTTLTSQPEMACPGRLSGTRELIVHPRYILAYRVPGTSSSSSPSGTATDAGLIASE